MKDQFILLLLVIVSISSYAQNANKPVKVYLLGTFHFAQTDSSYNVLDAKHQKSISDLTSIVAKLNPGKVFIERMPEFEKDNKMDSLYRIFVNSPKETRNRNEIWQVAARVAKQLGHKKLYQCDHPGMYGSIYAKVQRYANEHGQEKILRYEGKGVTKPYTSMVKIDSLRKTMTLLEYLQWLNSKPVQNSSHAHYVNVYPQLGYTNVYAYQENYLLGTELTADWYRRNIYTYSKIINQVDYTEKAIFLIIGNDHVPILRHLFESNPFFEVMDTAKWLGKSKNLSKADGSEVL